MQNDWCNLLQAVRHSSSYSEAADLIFLLCCHLIFPLSYFSQVLEVEIFINSEFIKRWKKKSQVLSDRVKNGTCDISFSPPCSKDKFHIDAPQTNFPLFFWVYFSPLSSTLIILKLPIRSEMKTSYRSFSNRSRDLKIDWALFAGCDVY